MLWRCERRANAPSECMYIITTFRFVTAKNKTKKKYRKNEEILWVEKEFLFLIRLFAQIPSLHYLFSPLSCD